ncbi:MAG: CYTH domain-containing protein [Planctomycetota bacterium]
MPIEYELKYLIEPRLLCFDQQLSEQKITQYYLLQEETRIVRFRRKEILQSSQYELTLKFKRDQGNPEFNFSLSPQEGHELLEILQEDQVAFLKKTRHLFQAEEVDIPDLFWEVDIFEEPLFFLGIAELEYPGPKRPNKLEICPSWYLKPELWPIEVTSDTDFLNNSLVSLKGSALNRFRKKVQKLLSTPASKRP